MDNFQEDHAASRRIDPVSTHRFGGRGNQYDSITTPGSFDVIGRAPANDTVTVNSQATVRKGDRFQAEVTADNSSAAVWKAITVSDGTLPDIEGSRYIPKATVAPTYDDDGNLRFDGRWDYDWDAENRLASMTTNPAAQATGEPYRRLVFSYDWMGKRIRKQVFDSPPPATPLEDIRFAYDGWNMIAEYTSAGGTLALFRGYTWGTDLSSTEQGAGGVGGLLSVRQGGASYAASYDGNGNIVGWVNTVGLLASRQEFDPFGNRIVHEGSVDMSLGFSTKYQDKETGLLYYGHRYYDAVLGRWPSRDPIEEAGGINIYAFVGNLPVSKVDRLGLVLLNPPAPNDRMKLLLWKASGTVRQSMFGNLSKMQELIEELLVSYDEHWVVVNVLLDESQDDPDYNWITDTITLIDPENESSAIHEMIHMYNDKSNSSFQGEIFANEEEGMAYGGERIYSMVKDDNLFKFLNETSAGLSDEAVRRRLADRWKFMWSGRSYGGADLRATDSFNGEGWKFWDRGDFPITMGHFSKLEDKLHARFSCEEAAKIVNSLPLALKSCVRVSCEQGKPYFSSPDGFWVIPATVFIHPSIRR